MRYPVFYSFETVLKEIFPNPTNNLITIEIENYNGGFEENHMISQGSS